MNKISFWFDNARPVSLPQSLLPAFTAVAIASVSNEFSLPVAALCILGVTSAHLGMNLADDWFDYRVQSAEMRKKLASEGIRARMTKYPYLTSGEATPGQLLAVTGIFLAIALACGTAVALLSGWKVLYFALAGFLIGISYSGKPLKLGFRGLGELVIFLMFGPLMMTGIHYACTGEVSREIVLVSAAVGLLVTNIVYSHSIMDAEHDIKVGKRTMAHLMGSRKGQIVLSAIINILPFVLIIAGVAFGGLSWAYLLTLPLAPLSFWLVRSLADFAFERPTEVKRKPWMGSKAEFEKYEKAGIGWFMLRWLTARSIVTYFCLVIIVVNIVLAVLK